MTEQDLGRHVVDWLQCQDYTVYHEVRDERDRRLRFSPVADIVVDVNGHAWVIELKRSFGLAVLAQAKEWQRRGVSRVSIAVRHAGDTKARRFGEHVCRQFGIGLLCIDKHGSVREEIEPRYYRAPVRYHTHDLLSICHAAQQSGVTAGSARGGYWTPYRQTMRDVKDYLQRQGDWCSLHMIMASIPHHYHTSSTARSCLSKWLQTVEAAKDWVECRRNGRRLEFRFTGLSRLIDSPTAR